MSATPPSYLLLSSIVTGTWVASPGWAVLAASFTWRDMNSGVVPASDLLAVRFRRALFNLFKSPATGRGTLALDNGAFAYPPSRLSPGNYWSLKAITSTGSIYPLYAGVAQEYRFNLDFGRQSVDVDLNDNASLLSAHVSLGMALGIPVSSLGTAMAEAAGFLSGYRDVDAAMSDVVPFVIVDNEPAGEALHRLVASGDHAGWIDGRGRLILRDRNADMFQTVAASHEGYLALSGVLNRDSLYNRVRLTFVPHVIDTAPTTISFITQGVAIASGQTVTFGLEYLNTQTGERGMAANSIAAVLPGVDYTILTQTGSEFTDISSEIPVRVAPFAQQALVEVTNVYSGDIILATFALQGYGIRPQPPNLLTDSRSASQALYGDQLLEFENSLITDPFRNFDYVTWLVNIYSSLRPGVNFQIRNDFPAILEADLGRKVTLTNTLLGFVGSAYVITDVEHTIVLGRGHEHTVAYGVEMAPTKAFFVLDADWLDGAAVLGF